MVSSYRRKTDLTQRRERLDTERVHESSPCRKDNMPVSCNTIFEEKFSMQRIQFNSLLILSCDVQIFLTTNGCFCCCLRVWNFFHAKSPIIEKTKGKRFLRLQQKTRFSLIALKEILWFISQTFWILAL